MNKVFGLFVYLFIYLLVRVFVSFFLFHLKLAIPVGENFAVLCYVCGTVVSPTLKGTSKS